MKTVVSVPRSEIERAVATKSPITVNGSPTFATRSIPTTRGPPAGGRTLRRPQHLEDKGADGGEENGELRGEECEVAGHLHLRATAHALHALHGLHALEQRDHGSSTSVVAGITSRSRNGAPPPMPPMPCMACMPSSSAITAAAPRLSRGSRLGAGMAPPRSGPSR